MKKRDFFRSAGATVAVMILATLLSKALGLVRQMMTAAIFAASMEGIAFSTASRLPLAIFDMLFSTAVVGAFLPIYKGNLSSDKERAKRFSSSFLTTVTLVTAAVSLLGILFAEPLIALSAPDLDEKTASLAVTLLRIMFPSMIFAGAAYTLVGILQSHESFILPALVSAISNLVMIVYLLFCKTPVDQTAAIGFAFAYLISWLAQFLTLAVPLFRKGFLPSPTARLNDPDTMLALRRSLPVMFGSWLIPMITLAAGAFSSFIPGGVIENGAQTGAAIVVYENAFSVFSIAAGLLTYGVCNYIFPKLSARAANKDGEGFSRLIQNGLFASAALILPITIFVFLLSDEIVTLLYMRGAFSAGLAAAAGKSLRMLSLAMPAYGIIELLSRVCYSDGKVRLPMLSSFCGIASALTAFFIFRLTDMLSVETVALSVAIGLSAAALTLYILCARFFTDMHKGMCFSKYILLLTGCAVSGVVMFFSKLFLEHFLNFSGAFQNFITIAIVFITGFMVYLIWLIMTKIINAEMFR
ncbi:MAG: murein biosynthesis integral membrane protein MurJ [Clostridia bacterium]|nr:murein biosynthesis integral membrane protein MurJ [Clostridia bacterium]